MLLLHPLHLNLYSKNQVSHEGFDLQTTYILDDDYEKNNFIHYCCIECF